MPGKYFTPLFEIAAGQYGYVTAQDAQGIGVPAKRLAENAALERIGHGLYRFAMFPVAQLDQYMEATLWPRGVRGVLSHDTALDLHELCDVNPAQIDVTVPKAYRTNPTREIPKLYRLHRCDLALAETSLHESIPIVTPYRAILDGIEAHLRSGLIRQAIGTAQRRGLLKPGQADELTHAVHHRHAVAR